MTKIRRDVWNTYATSGYSHSFTANGGAASGGVCLHQLRRTRQGGWQIRAVNSNGRHQEFGTVEPIDAARGEALFAQAESY